MLWRALEMVRLPIPKVVEKSRWTSTVKTIDVSSRMIVVIHRVELQEEIP
jgi:hypothetical protein